MPALIQSFIFQSLHSFRCDHRSLTKFIFPPSVQSNQNQVRIRLLLLDLKSLQVIVMHLLHHVRNLSNHNGIYRHYHGDIHVHNVYNQPLMYCHLFIFVVFQILCKCIKHILCLFWTQYIQINCFCYNQQ